MSYKKLSELVHLVDIKNTDCKVTRVIGVSITKNFIPSVANLNGVDLTKYNLIKKNQFACKLMSVGRDLQLPIDLYKEDDLALISSAYYVFEVKDENEILPDYLNMWFRRKETDRWVGYISGGDVRGGISWDMFLEMEVNVPSIEKQREIVAQYQAVANKIKVNEQICEKLEAAAQTLYKQWFVDFEFPNEEGKPYKSSGGKMVWNEELEKKIPEGWEVGIIGDVVTTQYGFTDIANPNSGSAKFLRITDVVNSSIDWNNVPFCNNSDKEISKYLVEFGDILISRTGANVGYGKMIWKTVPKCVFASFLVRLKPISDEYISFLYCLIISENYRNFVLNNAEGSAQPQANASILTKMNCFIPPSRLLIEFNKVIFSIIDQKENLENQNQKLTQLQSLLLSRLARLEG